MCDTQRQLVALRYPDRVEQRILPSFTDAIRLAMQVAREASVMIEPATNAKDTPSS